MRTKKETPVTPFPLGVDYRIVTHRYGSISRPTVARRTTLSLYASSVGTHASNMRYGHLRVTKISSSDPVRILCPEWYSSRLPDPYTWANFEIKDVEAGDTFDVRVIDVSSEEEVDQFTVEVSADALFLTKKDTTVITTAVKDTTSAQPPRDVIANRKSIGARTSGIA